MAHLKSPVRFDAMDPAVRSPEYRSKVLSCLPFFVQLPPEPIFKINGLFRDRDISADQRIHCEGDQADHFYLAAPAKRGGVN